MEPIASTSSDVFTGSETAPRSEFRVYKRRYFLLATLFMLNLSNAMVNNDFYISILCLCLGSAILLYILFCRQYINPR